MPPNPYELVIRKCKEYEAHLASRFGARGSGLGEKARDVATRLDPRVLSRLRRIAATRNKLVHELGFSRSIDLHAFARDCAVVDEYWGGGGMTRTTRRLTIAIDRDPPPA